MTVSRAYDSYRIKIHDKADAKRKDSTRRIGYITKDNVRKKVCGI
jgi:hypothetical protein